MLRVEHLSNGTLRVGVQVPPDAEPAEPGEVIWDVMSTSGENFMVAAALLGMDPVELHERLEGG